MEHLRGRWPTRTFLVTALILVAAGGRADVTMPSIFGSHMVLQRDRAIPVWGWAEPGEEVAVTLAETTVKATTGQDGSWRLELPALSAGTGITVTVTGANTITFEDVAVGEVWLCSGQSNMEMGVTACLNAEEEIAAADHPDIRLIDVPKVLSPVPRKDFEGTWVRCSPETIAKHGSWGGFSACAYYFGRDIHSALDVPVGLIDSSWGGSRIEPWAPPIGFQSVPSLASVAERLTAADPTSAEHKRLTGEYLTGMQTWLQTARQALAAETLLTPPPERPPQLAPLAGTGDPAAMYNAMVHPLVPFAIRGAIWYQGESNHHDRAMYVDKTKALVQGWRSIWNDPDMPYYYVQIAPYEYGSEDPEILATFWEAQAAIEKAVPHTGMAVIHDVGNIKDIHPRNKQAVGQRLARLALHETYGRRDLVCRGPLFTSLTVEDGRLRVSFENADGLTTRDAAPPNWFEIIGENGDFVKADAVIDGASVLLTAPGVRRPAAVRFAWNKTAEPNLMNGAELPAAPFRAGEIPLRARLDSAVPEAKDYELVYSLELPNVDVRNEAVVYDVDRRTEIDGSFDRIAYFLDVRRKDGSREYAFVSLDAFTDDLGKIGVPDFASKALFQQPVAHMLVRSNVAGLGTGDDLPGNIEFWPCNYAPNNAAKVAGASDSQYDFGDEVHREVANGYACMQVHNTGARQVVFAYNNWKARGGADIGIGNSPQGHPDWTFTKSAAECSGARLQILVRPRK